MATEISSISPEDIPSQNAGNMSPDLHFPHSMIEFTAASTFIISILGITGEFIDLLKSIVKGLQGVMK